MNLIYIGYCHKVYDTRLISCAVTLLLSLLFVNKEEIPRDRLRKYYAIHFISLNLFIAKDV